MDEATANIDLETDKAVQSAIQEQFCSKGTTVITIAHRLHTVIDSDQILVMKGGTLAEDGHPHDLLCKYLGEVQTVGADSTNTQYRAGSEAPAGGGVLDVMVTREELNANKVENVQTPRHSLASLVQQTGPEMCLRLRKIAASAAAK